MTNKEKLEKIRSEVIWYIHLRNEGLIIGSCGDFEKLLKFIDSMQEEPKECMYSKDTYTDEDRKVLCGGCEEDCRFNKKEESVNNGIDLGCGVIWRDEEPVSEVLEKEAIKYAQDKYMPIQTSQAFKAGANWQKKHLTKAVKVKISNAGIISLPSDCDLKVGDKVLIIKEK